MESIYVSLKAGDLTFEPLMNKVDTIKSVREMDKREADGFTFYLFFVNRKYSPKMRVFSDGMIQASCNCPDFYYNRKKTNQFCKHIYACLDKMNKEKNSF
jgi:hypothetical protein